MKKMQAMKYRSRWAVAAISLFLQAGSGQIYNGQALKGIAFFVLYWSICFLCYYFGVATTFYGSIGALCFYVLLFLYTTTDAICNAGREISLHWYNRWYIYLLPLAIALAVGAVSDISGVPNLSTFGVRSYRVPSSSMKPTLLPGDRIIVDFRPSARKPTSIGDVVVFKYPEDMQKDFIARVIGLPGDKIKIDGKNVYINDKKLEHVPVNIPEVQDDKHKEAEIISPWWDGEETEIISPIEDIYKERFGLVEYLVQFDRDETQRLVGYFMTKHGGEVTVPEGQLFLMGDNRDNSNDSREWGCVPMVNLQGNVRFIFWSPDHSRIGRDLLDLK